MDFLTKFPSRWFLFCFHLLFPDGAQCAVVMHGCAPGCIARCKIGSPKPRTDVWINAAVARHRSLHAQRVCCSRSKPVSAVHHLQPTAHDELFIGLRAANACTLHHTAGRHHYRASRRVVGVSGCDKRCGPVVGGRPHHCRQLLRQPHRTPGWACQAAAAPACRPSADRASLQVSRVPLPSSSVR